VLEEACARLRVKPYPPNNMGLAEIGSLKVLKQSIQVIEMDEV